MKAIQDLHDAKMAYIAEEHKERVTKIWGTAFFALVVIALIIAFV